jgi:hypothetical protein
MPGEKRPWATFSMQCGDVKREYFGIEKILLLD